MRSARGPTGSPVELQQFCQFGRTRESCLGNEVPADHFRHLLQPDEKIGRQGFQPGRFLSPQILPPGFFFVKGLFCS